MQNNEETQDAEMDGDWGDIDEALELKAGKVKMNAKNVKTVIRVSLFLLMLSYKRMYLRSMKALLDMHENTEI